MSMAYVGITPCGCLVAAAVDEPQYAQENARTVASWIRTGLTIERVEADVVRARLTACHCNGGTCEGQLTIEDVAL